MDFLEWDIWIEKPNDRPNSIFSRDVAHLGGKRKKESARSGADLQLTGLFPEANDHALPISGPERVMSLG